MLGEYCLLRNGNPRGTSRPAIARMLWDIQAQISDFACRASRRDSVIILGALRTSAPRAGR